LDHMMPSPDGIETLAAIRNDKNSLNKDTTAIVLTANAVAGSRQMYLDAGFADYLTKPLDSLVLEQAVRKYLPFEKVLPVAINTRAADSTDEEDGALDTAGSGAEDEAAFATANSIGGEREMAVEAEEVKEEEDYSVVEFMPSEGPEDEAQSPASKYGDLKEKLSKIEGVDYETAMLHCANDESVLAEILDEISSDSRARANRMLGFIREKDWASYRVESHAIKGLMATIGASKLSNRAKKHEFAARDQQYETIEGDGTAFIEEYVEICDRLGEVLKPGV